MKIKNIDMVKLVNASDSLIKKKLPSRISYVLNCNLKTLASFAQAYKEAFDNAQQAGEDVTGLINQEIDVAIQKVPQSTLDLLDNSDKYDVLSFAELDAIMFMIGE